MNEFLHMSLEQLEAAQHAITDQYLNTRLALIELGIKLNNIEDAITAQKSIIQES